MQTLLQKTFKRMYKPEYYYQPLKLIDRLKYKFNPPSDGMQKIKLSWGRDLVANPHQTIGLSLATYGLYDLALSEMILRLVRPGDLVIDGGANVGYTSCLMLDCLKGKGRLLSYEPLPELFEILKENLRDGSSVAEPYMLALSDKVGSAVITLPNSFNGNDGVATLEGGEVQGKKLTIPTITLDSLNLDVKVRLMKLDVEGHEISVLKGAEKSLDRGIFEYIIYEDLAGAGGETLKFLESKGFKVYKIVKEFSGLSLKEPNFDINLSYEPDNFLATKDVGIVDKINNHKKWQFFKWKKSQ
jgi:FkbM family methyltransferase